MHSSFAGLRNLFKAFAIGIIIKVFSNQREEHVEERVFALTFEECPRFTCKAPQILTQPLSVGSVESEPLHQ